MKNKKNLENKENRALAIALGIIFYSACIASAGVVFALLFL